MSTQIEIHISSDPLQYDLCDVDALTTGVQYVVRLVFPPAVTVDAQTLRIILTGSDRTSIVSSSVSKAPSGVNAYDVSMFIPDILLASKSSGVTPIPFSIYDDNARYTSSTLPVISGVAAVDPADPYGLAPRVAKLEQQVAELATGAYTASHGVKIVGQDIQLTHDLAAAIRALNAITDQSTVADLVAVIKAIQTASK